MSVESFFSILGREELAPSSFGGKAASLSRLRALGYRIPLGFAVSTSALQQWLARLSLSDALEQVGRDVREGSSSDAASRIHDALLSTPLASDLLGVLLETCDRVGLWRDGERDSVIVRSSATVEDSATRSFAGIFESFPIGSRQGLDVAIRRVWASAFSPRAIAYLTESGASVVPLMGVVVQRFLDADRSGVMFTRYPSPWGDVRVLIEHVEGGCEKLVKGEVTPERLWLSVGSKTATDPLLGTHAAGLGRLAESLERELGSPQDVEWCIKENELHVLQSRPITALVHAGETTGTGLEEPILRGVAASSGAGDGPVHLVFNIEDALRIKNGDVLVTPMTNPDMVVAMRNSVAIVTDVGGIICHAAIVSRELGLPCVVGTATATSDLKQRQHVTVDGANGAVYAGRAALREPTKALQRPLTWPDLWRLWQRTTAPHAGAMPLVSSSDALRHMPPDIADVVLVPDVDLRTNEAGLWLDLEGMTDPDRARTLDEYFRRVEDALEPGSNAWIHVVTSLPVSDIQDAMLRVGGGRLRPLPADRVDRIVTDRLRKAIGEDPIIPLGCAPDANPLPETENVVPVETFIRQTTDTVRFFGHEPRHVAAGMPDHELRSAWWRLLPEYGRFHEEHLTRTEAGEFTWLEVRPELVISALLKSLVQPGFEMVPRVLRFAGLPPMHIKWIRGRYHFRADVFAKVWTQIVHATWDQSFMVDLLRRIRRSYEDLDEVLTLFPASQHDARSLSHRQIVALLTSWWPRWVEFFALCWFIQAQGDDIAYPFIEATVANNLEGMGPAPEETRWPEVMDLVAPTTPVMSGEYMASVAEVRELLLAADLGTADKALEALRDDRAGDVADRVTRHLRDWYWMRDRDLVFEPWDTPERVVETALKTDPHAVPDYAENLRRHRLALSVHFDVALSTGRAEALNRMARLLHDLNVERENHHVLWLRFSYPLRALFLEVQRRLIRAGSDLQEGDVFFVQAPELIAALLNLPRPLPDGLIRTIKNRRAGFVREARLPGWETKGQQSEENDYL